MSIPSPSPWTFGDMLPPDAPRELQPNFDSKAAEILSLALFHFVCSYDLSQHHPFPHVPSAEINLGVLIDCPSTAEMKDSVEVAYIPTIEFGKLAWLFRVPGGKFQKEGRPAGWTRCDIFPDFSF